MTLSLCCGSPGAWAVRFRLRDWAGSGRRCGVRRGVCRPLRYTSYVSYPSYPSYAYSSYHHPGTWVDPSSRTESIVR